MPQAVVPDQAPTAVLAQVEILQGAGLTASDRVDRPQELQGSLPWLLERSCMPGSVHQMQMHIRPATVAEGHGSQLTGTRHFAGAGVD